MKEIKAYLPEWQQTPTPGWWVWWDSRFFSVVHMFDFRGATSDPENLLGERYPSPNVANLRGKPVKHCFNHGLWNGPHAGEAEATTAKQQILKAYTPSL